jgi:hypothetical protein
MTRLGSLVRAAAEQTERATVAHRGRGFATARARASITTFVCVPRKAPGACRYVGTAACCAARTSTRTCSVSSAFSSAKAGVVFTE